jgi:A1 cistron-splicing factor AAR2
MEQEMAQKLFEAGAMLLLLDVPPNTQFGIDCMCWQTGVNFKGVKMIPPGVHFVYFNPVDKYGQLGVRSGFFRTFSAREIVAKRWSVEIEAIDRHFEFSSSELESFMSNKQELDKFTGAYPYEEYKRWLSLSNYMNEKLVAALMPASGSITSVSSLIGPKYSSSREQHRQTCANERNEKFAERLKAPASLQEAESRLPVLHSQPGNEIRFTKIPTEAYPAGSSAAEITMHSIDRSYALQLMLELQQNALNIDESEADRLRPKTKPETLTILGELQFAFVCFLVGQVYEGFEQWKRLLSLLCNCESAIWRYPDLFVQFIQCLHFQLKELPSDFFADILTSNNFLIVNLHNLFDNINSTCDKCLRGSDSDKALADDDINMIKKLHEKSVSFKNYLQQTFGFDFANEPDEYAPSLDN